MQRETSVHFSSGPLVQAGPFTVLLVLVLVTTNLNKKQMDSHSIIQNTVKPLRKNNKPLLNNVNSPNNTRVRTVRSRMIIA